jgi:hypothetical protein
MPSILNSDDGVVSGTSGLKSTGGNDGLLNIQSNGTTVVAVTGTGIAVSGVNIGLGGGSVATNTAVGTSALAVNTTGANNTAVGYQALDVNTTGQQNTALGSGALGANTGSTNTAVGFQAGFSNTSGASGTFIGVFAGYSVTTGINNTFVGRSSGAAVSTNGYNTAVGYTAFNDNTGTENNAFGFEALGGPTVTGSGSYNSAFGFRALRRNTTGNYNSAFGNNALESNTTGANNTAVGYAALDANTTGIHNIAVGINALGANTTGIYNVSIGSNNLLNNTTGSQNIALGGSALGGNTTASNNTAVGYEALVNNTTGASNTAVGYKAGEDITTGIENICVGVNSGAWTSGVTTGSNNVHIGSYTNPSAGNVSSELVISASNNGATGKGANTGFINAQGGGNYAGNNSASWSTTSDRRLKKNIVDNNQGLEIINQIKVRNFEYRLPEEITELDPKYAINIPGVQLGPIAQELQEVCADCVTVESTGVLGVDSDDVFWHLVNAVKQLSSQVTALQTEVNQLKGQ